MQIRAAPPNLDKRAAPKSLIQATVEIVEKSKGRLGEFCGAKAHAFAPASLTSEFRMGLRRTDGNEKHNDAHLLILKGLQSVFRRSVPSPARNLRRAAM